MRCPVALGFVVAILACAPLGIAAEKRLWKDSSGKFSVEAELVNLSDTEVRLRKADGSVVSVPLDRLSADDRKFLLRQKVATTPPNGLSGVEDALRRKTTLSVEKAPLRDFFHQMAKQHGLQVFLDTPSLDDVGILTDHPITFQGADRPLEMALRQTLRDLRLDFYVQGNEVLVITNSEAARRRMETDVYCLLHPGGMADFNTLIRQIPEQISPNDWARVGGAGVIEGLRRPVPMLVVSTSYWVHREIEMDFADQLRRVHARGLTPSMNPGLPAPLLKPASFAVTDMKLEEFARYLSNTFGLPAVLDTKGLEDSGRGKDMPITADFADVRLATALDLALHNVGCAYTLDIDGSLLITGIDSRRQQTIARDYRVGPFVTPPGASLRKNVQGSDELIEVITSCITPGEWHSVGGPARCDRKGKDSITITHSIQGHLAVSELLAKLQAASTP